MSQTNITVMTFFRSFKNIYKPRDIGKRRSRNQEKHTTTLLIVLIYSGIATFVEPQSNSKSFSSNSNQFSEFF